MVILYFNVIIFLRNSFVSFCFRPQNSLAAFRNVSLYFVVGDVGVAV